MTHRHGAGLLIVAGLVLCSPAAAAGEETGPVIVCDALVNLRLLMAEGNRDVALSRLPAHPGCRMASRERIGPPEHRAMIGGAPFECLTIKGEGACAWVYP